MSEDADDQERADADFAGEQERADAEFMELLESSSLGSPAARRLRDRTDPWTAAEALGRRGGRATASGQVHPLYSTGDYDWDHLEGLLNPNDFAAYTLDGLQERRTEVRELCGFLGAQAQNLLDSEEKHLKARTDEIEIVRTLFDRATEIDVLLSRALEKRLRPLRRRGRRGGSPTPNHSWVVPQEIGGPETRS